MIRINLLGRPRPRVKRRVPVTGALQLALVLVPVALAVVALFVHYGIIRSAVSGTQKDIQQLQTQKTQMAQLEKEIKGFEEKQALLQGRLQVIEDLKRSQQGPVSLLEVVGRTVTLTETLWLTSMQETAPNQVEFEGVAGSMDAVANFITNLNQSGVFENVEMKEAVQQTQREGTANFEFTVSAKFALAVSSPAEAAAASAPAPASGRR